MFLTVLSLTALVLVAVTMGLSLAHALEFPGKLRLDEHIYRAVQAIYYPGFTVGGLVGEFGGMVVLAVLLVVLPKGTGQFWLVAGSLGSLLIGHLVYWMVTHPVNAAWLKDTKVSGLSATFFGLLSRQDNDWKRLRDAWEVSHIARAVMHLLGLLALGLSFVG